MTHDRTILKLMLTGFMVLATLSACAPVVKINKEYAPRDLPPGVELKRVAILGFEGPGGSEVGSRIQSMLADYQFDGRQYFTIIDSERWHRLAADYDRRYHGDVRPGTAARLGRQIGAEGIVFGQVTQNGVTRTIFRKTDKGCVASDKNGKCVKEGNVEKRCRKIRAHFAVAVRILDVSTSRIVYSQGRSGDAGDEHCERDDSRRMDTGRRESGRQEARRQDDRRYGSTASERRREELSREERWREERLREERRREEARQREERRREEARQDDVRGNELLDEARNRALSGLPQDIAPYTGEETVLLKNDVDSVPDAQKERFKQATAFAFQDRMDRACEIWQSMRDGGSRNLSVTFNLAICAEMNGRLNRALDLMEEADHSLKRPDYDINNSLKRIRSEIDEQRKMGNSGRS